MDVEMAYVQDSFLTNDVLQEMVSNLHVAATPGFPLFGMLRYRLLM